MGSTPASRAGALRESDTVVRLGGDEFALILEDCPIESAERIAEALLVSIGQPIELANQRRTVAASIGISVLPQDGDYGDDVDVEEVVRHTDRAMYEAKNAGKNQYRHFVRLTNTSLPQN